MLNRRFRECAGVAILALVVCAAPANAQRPAPIARTAACLAATAATRTARSSSISTSPCSPHTTRTSSPTPVKSGFPRFQKSGNVDNGTISLDYTRRAGHTTLDFTGGTSYRYYPSSGQDERIHLVRERGRERETVAADRLQGHRERQLPAVLLAGRRPPPDAGNAGRDSAGIITDYPLVQDSAISASSSASLDHRLSPRASLSADYLALSSHRVPGVGPGYDNWLAGGRYNHKLSSRASMRLGYHYRHLDNRPSPVRASRPTATISTSAWTTRVRCRRLAR